MASIAVTQAFDFTGGLNFRADQFQLAPNESPGMLNVEIDPRGGVFSRAGYKTKNTTAIPFSGDWNPKTLYNYKFLAAPQIMLSTGYQATGSYDGRVFYSSGGNFSTLTSNTVTPLNVKSPNGASFTQWEDTLYIALGKDATQMYKWKVGDPAATPLLASSPTWQPYQLPTGGYMPRAELTVAHANKLFVANTKEYNADATPTLTAYPNRLRWSHESSPENWFQDDYIDIIAGGDGIRGIQIVDGQLMIFKQKAIYLLLGYDADSFQLVEVSTTLGIDTPQQAAAGDGGVYFFDWPQGLYFYNRNGIQDIFERIRPIIINNEVNAQHTDVITVSYVRRRVWVSLPYAPAIDGPPPVYPSVNLIFDSTIGRAGAYTIFQTAPSFETEIGAGISGYGLVTGCDWRDADDKPYYLMTSQDDEWPYVYYVDDYDNTTDEVAGAPQFDGKYPSAYRTSWFADKTYAQLKTFIRPYFVFKEVQQDTAVYLQRFKNYDEANAVGGTRTIPLFATQTGSVYSTTTSPEDVYSEDNPPEPLAAGTATYGTVAVGAQIKRKGVAPLGRGYAIQLQFNGPDSNTPVGLPGGDFPGRKWGLNSIAYKFKRRKIRST
jgi:hypothetical protein